MIKSPSDGRGMLTAPSRVLVGIQ